MSNTLNTVYNNYLSTYTPKALTRYDTHKKSELRNVYNSIVKQNKEAPWYLPVTNTETQQYAVDLKENARDLYNVIAGLGGLEQEDLLEQKTAYSSNEDIVTVTYTGSEKSTNDISEYTMEIHAMAAPQENMGTFLPDKRVALPPGTYSFDAAIGGMNYEFQFTVASDETNMDVQARLARLINNSGIGIHASLEEQDGFTALRLSSEATGVPTRSENIFEISDNHTSKASGTVRYFGMDQVTSQATDSIVTINGSEYNFSSNSFTVDHLFDVDLHDITLEGETVTFGLKADTDSLAENVSRLLGGYNSLMQAANSYLESQARSSNLVRELKGIARHYEDSMVSTGLSMNEDGILQIDEELFKEAALSTDNLKESFSYLRGFSDSLLNKSRQISLNPMNYVNRTVVAYKKPGNNFVSPYNSSAYSGMMFNSYC